MPDHHFADRIFAAIERASTPLCVGLDPHLRHMPRAFRRAPDADPRAEDVRACLLEVIDIVADHVGMVKPQSAFYEQLGVEGIAVLKDVIAHGRAKGLVVILDGKRNDIGSTADAYCAAYLERGAPLEADAITVNPYLGLDSLEPFFAAARDHGKGVFVLVKTSNKGSSDYQDRRCDGTPLSDIVAASMSAASLAGQSEVSGWSSVGAVVGATHPLEGQRLRALLPRNLFLIPGYGAQGASARDAIATFVAGPRGLVGGVVNSSRAILFPSGAADLPLDGWRAAIREAVRHAATELGELTHPA
jgi:orotidine-5'-phosphate decarboxylase